MYRSLGRFSDAEDLANQLITANPNSDIEMNALIDLASLGGFNAQFAGKSKSAAEKLEQKFGNKVNQGLLAALGRSTGNKTAKNVNKEKLNDVVENTDTVTTFQMGNYPNPFNPTTIIRYQMPEAGNVTLKIYDILGREVKTLVDEFKDKGSYNVIFDGSNLASGIYIYTLNVNNFTMTKKLLLMK